MEFSLEASSVSDLHSASHSVCIFHRRTEVSLCPDSKKESIGHELFVPESCCCSNTVINAVVECLVLRENLSLFGAYLYAFCAFLRLASTRERRWKRIVTSEQPVT